VKSFQEISDTAGNFNVTLANKYEFGTSLTSVGDLDGDGVTDLAVGTRMDSDGGYQHGAVWLLYLQRDGTVKGHRKISDKEGGFSGALKFADWFGSSVASVGDLDGDGVGDLAVGAEGDDDGGPTTGAVWVLFLGDTSAPLGAAAKNGAAGDVQAGEHSKP
jgi:hypothetical protein